MSLTLYLIIRWREAESPGPCSLITAGLVRAEGGGSISAGERKGPPGKAPSLPIPPGGAGGEEGGSWAAVDAQIAPAQAATGLWRGEMGSLMGSNCPGEGREGEKVEVSMGVRRSG